MGRLESCATTSLPASCHEVGGSESAAWSFLSASEKVVPPVLLALLESISHLPLRVAFPHGFLQLLHGPPHVPSFFIFVGAPPDQGVVVPFTSPSLFFPFALMPKTPVQISVRRCSIRRPSELGRHVFVRPGEPVLSRFFCSRKLLR